MVGEAVPYESSDEEMPPERDDALVMHSWWRMDNRKSGTMRDSTAVQICFRQQGKLLTSYDAEGRWECISGNEYVKALH